MSDARPPSAPKRPGLYQYPDAATGAQRGRLGHTVDRGGSPGADAAHLCSCKSVWALPVGYADASQPRAAAGRRIRERRGTHRPGETSACARTPESPNASSAARLVLAVRRIGQTSWRLVTRVLGLGLIAVEGFPERLTFELRVIETRHGVWPILEFGEVKEHKELVV